MASRPGWIESPLSTRTLSTSSITTAIPAKPSTTLATIPDLPPSIAQSPLYRLPTELRTAIFSHLLCTPLGHPFPTPTLERGLHPALLRTCRAVHAETTPLLYAARPIFSHPSDANVWAHCVASPPAVAAHTTSCVLRVKHADVRLWTAYFNSLAPERSLVKDFPALRGVVVRLRGLRWDARGSAAANVKSWLRDGRVIEVVMAVRKCVADVRVELCVRVPEDWDATAWERTVEALIMEDPEGRREMSRWGGYVRFMAVWMRVETEGT